MSYVSHPRPKGLFIKEHSGIKIADVKTVMKYPERNHEQLNDSLRKHFVWHKY